MTRDELEAAIFRELRRASFAGAPDPVRERNSVVDAILTAADAYMVAEGGLTAERRLVLEEATAPKRGPR
jgi:hypothetical protein